MIFQLNRSVSVFNYSQWRLVCSKSTLGFLTSSIMFLGWLFGNIIFGILSDKYGRRKILFFSSCLVCWVAFVSSFVPWYWMYATLRFIIGFGLGKQRDDKFATLGTRRGLEPKCIPQWFLGLLLGPGQSAFGQFFSLSLVTLPEVLSKIYSSQFSFISKGANFKTNFCHGRLVHGWGGVCQVVDNTSLGEEITTE